MHGTGTPLGDPIEVAALGQAARPGQGFGGASHMTLGAVKSCYGHTEGAAGLTGALLAIQSLTHAVRVLTAPCISHRPMYVISWEHPNRIWTSQLWSIFCNSVLRRMIDEFSF